MFDSDPSVVNILLLTCSLFVKKISKHSTKFRTIDRLNRGWYIEEKQQHNRFELGVDVY